MASSSQEPQALPRAEMTTPPDSPIQGFTSKDVKKDNAIRGLLADITKTTTPPRGGSRSPLSIRDRLEHLLKATQDGECRDAVTDTCKLKAAETRTPPKSPCNASSEPVTTTQLIGLLEAALESKGSMDTAAFGHASAESDQGIPSGRSSSLCRTL